MALHYRDGLPAIPSSEDTRMSESLAALEPASLWGHFDEITRIPRPSGREEKIAAWVREIADRHGFEVETDARGNLFVSVPASPGREGAPTVMLQSHLDMVGEKNRGLEHDFDADPLRTRIEGEWVGAEGTTLGADNGIGVAAALAAATDPSVEHGPLQLVFTLDEETGLTGAAELDGSLMRGDTLLNLDSEMDGIIYVGCAGGGDSHIELDLESTAAPAGSTALEVEVRGLRGGHSGMEIHENRGNALKLLARLLLGAHEAGLAVELERIGGGGKHNAIPREASAIVHVSSGDVDALKRRAADVLEGARTELRGVDDGVTIEVRPADGTGRVLVAGDRDRLLRLIAALPHGVLAMSRTIPGLVETSSNLAAVTHDDAGTYRIVTSTRSSVMPSLLAVQQSIRAAAELSGARVETHDAYPGWQPDLDSAALKVVREVYGEIWGAEPEVTAIHAGLECGLLGEKKPGLDMVSFGPQIEGAHSPDERVNVPSVERFWRALGMTLRRLAS
jgi:dipeptidase D